MKIKGAILTSLGLLSTWYIVKYNVFSESGLVSASNINNVDILETSTTTRRNTDYIQEDTTPPGRIVVRAWDTGTSIVDNKVLPHKSKLTNSDTNKVSKISNDMILIEDSTLDVNPIASEIKTLSPVAVIASNQVPTQQTTSPNENTSSNDTYIVASKDVSTVNNEKQESAGSSVLDSIANGISSAVHGVSSAVDYVSSKIMIDKKHPDKGFYGSLKFLYEEEEQSINQSTIKEETFRQEYKLGYSGNIYSPRLLDYTLEGLVRIEDNKVQNTGNNSKIETNDYDYKVDLSFIKYTNYPFRIYLIKQEKPMSVINYNSITSYVYETNSNGIDGTVNLRPFIFTYGASNSERIANSINTLGIIKTTTYNSSLNYKNESQEIQINARHLEQKNTQNISDSNSTNILYSNQSTDEINLHHKWKISKDLRMNSRVSYDESEYYKLFSNKRTSADVNLQWRPEEKYYGSLAMNGSRLEYSSDGSSEVNILDTTNINQNFGYKFSPTLNIAQTASYMTSDGPTVKINGTTLFLRGSHNYKKMFYEDALLSLSTNVYAQNYNFETISKTDASLNNKKNVDTYNLSLNAVVTKPLPSIKSDVNLRSSYSKRITTEDESQENYYANLMLSSNIFSIIRNTMYASYMQSNSTSSGGELKNSSSTTTLSESMSINGRIGLRGGWDAIAGIKYSNISTDSVSVTRVDPKIDLGFRYRFFRRLMFSSRAKIDKSFDTTNYSGKADLSFKTRKFSFLMGYKYNKSETSGSINAFNTERSVFKIQLSRDF